MVYQGYTGSHSSNPRWSGPSPDDAAKQIARWSRAGTLQVHLDSAEDLPHRSGAGRLWDFDKFWVKLSLDGRGFVRTKTREAIVGGTDRDGDEDKSSVAVIFNE